MAGKRTLSRLVAMLALGAGLAGVAAAPATADVTAAQSYCGDSSARWFNLSTSDHWDDVRGGNTFGYIAVTPDPYGGYKVCVGWPGEPTAEVSDRDADGYGAAAYARYEQLGAGGWQTVSWHLMKRADGDGVVAYYESTFRQVRNFYVLVCRIKSGDPHNSCSGLG